MDYKQHIAIAVEYMEDNLTQDISLSDCARACGYSEYHFLRIFREVTGLTPADYIRKRRLTEIAKRICGEDEHISDLAFAYGFNSKENFIRAFKSEHHILPTEYRQALNSLKLYERFTSISVTLSVTPEILNIDSFTLTVYRSDEPYPPHFWNRYNARNLSKRLSGGRTFADYGVSIYNCHEKRLYYYIGIRSEQASGDTSGTDDLLVDGGLYAVFHTPKTTHENFVNTIHRTWHYINAVWLPESRYEFNGNSSFETYIEESRMFSESIFIPIKEVKK